MKVFGKNVLKELLNDASKIKKIYISNNFRDNEIINKIKNSKVTYEIIDKQKLDKIEKNNQGIMAITLDYEYFSEDEIFNFDNILILDHIEDPHNFGAIIRTCDAAGIEVIVIPKDRACLVNETVMKTSTGAISYVKIVMVTNLVNTINKLKKNNYFVYGAEANGEDYRNVSYADKKVLVIGSEGNGLSNLVRKSCDIVLSIPMKGHVNSLNASVAAGILIYKIFE